MATYIADLAFTKLLWYVAPLVFILSALTVADRLVDLIRSAFMRSAYGYNKRRSG